jgi:predicted transcriptional regulator
MASSAPNLRLLDNPRLASEFDLASALFHRINKVIPENQVVLSVPPSCLAREAILRMREHGYSQVPVVENGEVLGVCSFRSFAKKSATATLDELTGQRLAPGDLRVDEFLEQFDFARVTEEMSRVFDAMDRDNGILIGTPEKLIGVVTPMNFLRYLYQFAEPFVLISEIELALRALIQHSLSREQITAASRRSLASAYSDETKVPTVLEDMTFDNYRSLICHGQNWHAFESAFGGTRTLISAKLKEIGALRNDLFH